MVAQGSTYFLLACVVVAAMGVVGLGLFFVRAEHIERRNLVAVTTLVFSLIAAALLWNGSHRSLRESDALAWSCIAISLFGFALGRVWDAILGSRSKVHRDPATLGSDLSD